VMTILLDDFSSLAVAAAEAAAATMNGTAAQPGNALTDVTSSSITKENLKAFAETIFLIESMIKP
jgi:hypothetical protein